MKKHKNIIIFLVKFFVTYFVLVAIYNGYLQNSQQKDNGYKTSSITTLVANQSVKVLRVFGYQVEAVQHDQEMSVKLIIEGQYAARVIEGCNSISVIILFISFIIAFAGRFKPTFLYVIGGSVLIYAVNLTRIVILTIGLFHYPWRREILHTIIFPLIIYGMVFLLWMFWVNRYSAVRKTNE